jgi:AAA family ATP:ADP antiporter
MSAGTLTTTAATTRTARRPAWNWLDACLAPFAEIRPGEAHGALLLAADIFCLLGSYYLLKTARESLILSEGSAEVKSYAAGAQALILLAVVPAYAALAARMTRSRLINGVMVFFASHLVLFHALASHGVPIGIAFFLWVGVFNLVIVAQFWAFANDLYSVERGERLFPLVGVGASLGAWFGARAASRLIGAHLDARDLLVIAAAGLIVCVALNVSAARVVSAEPARRVPAAPERPLDPTGAFQLILTDRYLRLIALLVIVVNVVNTIGEYLLGRVVVAEVSRTIASGAAGGFTKAQLIGMFYGDFFGWVNLLGFAIQLFVVSRVFKRLGAGGALMVLPAIACCSYALLAFLPVIGAVRAGKLLENSTDYSLQNTARHALFLPTSREAKFKAKQAIDALCWRIGDVLQAAVVFAGVRLAFGVREFALLNEALVAVWVCIAVAIYREYARQTRRPAG